MVLAWCKVSSLTAAVSRTLKGTEFPMARSAVLEVTKDKVVEGWELNYFLSQALRRKKYQKLAEVVSDLEDWVGAQG